MKKRIFVIIGSASRNSANEKLVAWFATLASEHLEFSVFNDLKTLPHFDPQLSNDMPPDSILDFRKNIEKADGVLICTPEYVFSIPAGLKNALEWCVATLVFSEKPVGLITASADGQMGHKQLQVIMKTLMAKVAETTTLLIPGIKGRMDAQGNLSDAGTREDLNRFLLAFRELVQDAKG